MKARLRSSTNCPVPCVLGSISGGSHKVRVNGIPGPPADVVAVGDGADTVGVCPGVGLEDGSTEVGLVKKEQPATRCSRRTPVIAPAATSTHPSRQGVCLFAPNNIPVSLVR